MAIPFKSTPVFWTILVLFYSSLVWADFEQPTGTGNAPDTPHAQEAHTDHARFDRNHIQNQEHIMNHLDGIVNKPESEMSEEELQFHYFKLHDYDNNNRLDGIEIINAMTHYHKGEKEEEHKDERMPDEELMSVVDGIMTDEDLNKDGYIDYSEFVTAQRGQHEEPPSTTPVP